MITRKGRLNSRSEGGKGLGKALGMENRCIKTLAKGTLITKNLNQDRACHKVETVRRPLWLE